jgi:hypothetical protein
MGLLMFITTSACSDHIGFDEWSARWEDTLEAIPTLETMQTADDDSAAAICAETLGILRSAAPEIRETEDPDLEHEALTFLNFAEAVFFECPIRSGSHAGFEAGYLEMERLQAVVEALFPYEE